MLIDRSYFIGEINIPNTDTLPVQENLQIFINKYEAKFLKLLLGETLYTDFINGLPTGDVTTVPGSFEVFGVNTHFITMFKVGDTITVNGETHTIDEIIDDLHLTTATYWDGSNIHTDYIGQQRWIDLENRLRDEVTKVSPIANFIYFYTTRDKTLHNGGTGVVQPEGENSYRGDSKIKTTRAWNEMCELTFEIYKFLKINVAIYGPVPYSLRFINNWLTWDWCFWWSWYPVIYRPYIPEIYQPINTLNW